MREVKVQLRQKGLRVKEILVITTLLDAQQYRPEEIAKLYRARWNAELDLRSLQATLKMDVFAWGDTGHGPQRDLGPFAGIQSDTHA